MYLGDNKISCFHTPNFDNVAILLVFGRHMISFNSCALHNNSFGVFAFSDHPNILVYMLSKIFRAFSTDGVTYYFSETDFDKR